MSNQCLIVGAADEITGWRNTDLCLLTRQVFESRDAAQAHIDTESLAFPGGRIAHASTRIVECYFGTNLRPAGAKYSKRGIPILSFDEKVDALKTCLANKSPEDVLLHVCDLVMHMYGVKDATPIKEGAPLFGDDE